MNYELSNALLSWPLFRKPERLQVMLALLLSREEDGSILPNVPDRLPLLTGLSLVTVQRSLQDLMEAGVLMCVSGIDVPVQLMFANLPEGVKEDTGIPVTEPSVKPKKRSKSAPRHFVKPTLEEVTAYIQEQGYSVDPQYFIDYEETVGWVVGKTRKPMKDWKAAVRLQEYTNRKPSAHNNKPLTTYEQQRQSSRDIYIAAEAGSSVRTVDPGLLAIPDDSACRGSS